MTNVICVANDIDRSPTSLSTCGGMRNNELYLSGLTLGQVNMITCLLFPATCQWRI